MTEAAAAAEGGAPGGSLGATLNGINNIMGGALGNSSSTSGSQSTDMEQFVSMLQSIMAQETTNQTEQSTTDSTSSSNAVGTENMQSMLDQLVNSIQQQTSQSSDIDEETLSQQQGIFGQLQQMFSGAAESDRFSREQAITTAKNARDGAINQSLRQTSADVDSAGVNAGAYGSTVTSNLNNQATALAAEQGAQTELNTIQQFEQNRQSEMDSLVQSLNQVFTGMRGAETQQSATGTTKETTNQSEQARTDTQQQEFVQNLTSTLQKLFSQTDSTQVTDTEQETTGSTDTTTSSSQDNKGWLSKLNPFD